MPRLAKTLSQQPKPSRKHLGWFLLLRVIFICVFLGGTVVYQVRDGLGTVHPALPYFYLLIGVSFAHALASAISLPRVRNLVFFTQTQVAWDLFFCFLLILLTGGTESPFPFLFVFIIISSSVFFSNREVLVVAAASSILYGGLIDFQYYGMLPSLPGWPALDAVGGRDAFYTIFIHVAAFFLTALLSGALSERWRRSEKALAEQRIDYDELDALNKAILGNIASGLMIVNSQGRIRLFNHAAEQISGRRLEEVYNHRVDELFPDLKIWGGDEFQICQRAEGSIVDAEGRSKVLGYATSRIRDPQRQDLGLLVSFQDLTQVKEMEEQLKRNDRLAAIGRLSSAMAHEIRNPLASISGSVQLMMEAEGVSAEDRRLMGIVVKEAERLSSLLTDFLTYARPKPPERDVCDVSRLIDELVDMCAADPRFGGIDILRTYSPGTRFLVDRDQLRQALWGLMINAAEALKDKGQIAIGVDASEGLISVEDTGPGVPPELAERIFEPFFTTKGSGSGLGLATVFTLIEGHGGSVELTDGAHSGARFLLRFGPNVVLS